MCFFIIEFVYFVVLGFCAAFQLNPKILWCFSYSFLSKIAKIDVNTGFVTSTTVLRKKKSVSSDVLSVIYRYAGSFITLQCFNSWLKLSECSNTFSCIKSPSSRKILPKTNNFRFLIMSTFEIDQFVHIGTCNTVRFFKKYSVNLLCVTIAFPLAIAQFESI